MKITIIGAGNMGRGLAMRFAMAGHEVTIASFSMELAEEAAEYVREKTGCTHIYSGLNADAASAAELVALVIPVASRREVLESLREILREKIVLDITIPMAFNPVRYAPPSEGSNALETQAILGEGSRVTSGFHTVSFTLLHKVELPLSGSTLIVGSDEESRKTVMTLAESVGLRPVDAGGLEHAHTVESLTPMLLDINKRYGSKSAGIDVTGIDL